MEELVVLVVNDVIFLTRDDSTDGAFFGINPSDGKLAALVGDGAFGRWACLDMMKRGLVLFAQCHPRSILVLRRSGFDVCWYGVFWIWIDLEINRRKVGLVFSKKVCLRKEKQERRCWGLGFWRKGYFGFFALQDLT